MGISKKIGRMLMLSIFIILASFGMAFGVNYRERFMHKETLIELVEKKEDEAELEHAEVKE